MPTLEKGIVQRFFKNNGRNPFGFIASIGTADKRDVHFRWDSYFLLNFDDQKTFCFSRGIYPHPTRTVHVGEMVYFERGFDGRGRPQASMWCFEADFERALDDLDKRSPGSALAFFRETIWWNSLVESASLTEIGLTGHVSTPERCVAEEQKLRGLTDFEKKILGPAIRAEKDRRQDIFRQVMISELDEDPDADF